MQQEQDMDRILSLLSDRVLEALRQRLENDGKLELQSLKQITGLVKDLRELRSGSRAGDITVIFTGEAESLSE